MKALTKHVYKMLTKGTNVVIFQYEYVFHTW